MSAGFVCPLCKRVIKLVRLSGSLMIEAHNWVGERGDLIDRLHSVQYEMDCPLSGRSVRKAF